MKFFVIHIRFTFHHFLNRRMSCMRVVFTPPNPYLVHLAHQPIVRSISCILFLLSQPFYLFHHLHLFHLHPALLLLLFLFLFFLLFFCLFFVFFFFLSSSSFILFCESFFFFLFIFYYYYFSIFFIIFFLFISFLQFHFFHFSLRSPPSLF